MKSGKSMSFSCVSELTFMFLKSAMETPEQYVKFAHKVKNKMLFVMLKRCDEYKRFAKLFKKY